MKKSLQYSVLQDNANIIDIWKQVLMVIFLKEGYPHPYRGTAIAIEGVSVKMLNFQNANVNRKGPNKHQKQPT